MEQLRERECMFTFPMLQPSKYAKFQCRNRQREDGADLVYREDELRRALARARRVENRAPAEPRRPRTTVGFSGESVQPVWA